MAPKQSENKIPSLSQRWQGHTQILCGGRVVTGAPQKAPMVTFALLASLSTLFLVFPARYLGTELSTPGFSIVGALFVIATTTFFLLAASTDPGILPTSTDHYAPSNIMRPPRSQNFVTNKQVTLKYCEICRVYQPPRTVHCTMCNNCVQRFDHHCPWVGNCIGVRNYRYFMGFLVSATLFIVYIIGASIAELVIRSTKGSDDQTRFLDGIGAIVCILVAFVCSWFIVVLLSYHLYLLWTNRTTYEQIKSSYSKVAHPHGFGCDPLISLMLGSRGPSLVREWAKIESKASFEDVQRSGQGIGPAHPLWGLGNSAQGSEVGLRAFKLGGSTHGSDQEGSVAGNGEDGVGFGESNQKNEPKVDTVAQAPEERGLEAGNMDVEMNSEVAKDDVSVSTSDVHVSSGNPSNSELLIT